MAARSRRHPPKSRIGKSKKFKRPAGRPGRNTARPRGGIIPENDLLGFIAANGGRAEKAEIAAAFELGRGHRKALQEELTILCRRRVLFDDDGVLVLRRRGDFVRGVLTMNPRGFGFVVPEGEQARGEGDIFVSGSNIGAAMHGDTVLVRVLGRRGAKRDGVILRVVERGSNLVVGVYTAGKTGFVTPEDERFPFKIIVRREQSRGARDGEAVVARMTSFHPSGMGNPKGEIVEVLGDPDSIAVQSEIVIRKFQLPHEWSSAALAELEAVDGRVRADAPGREDLRAVRHITIDGETARDFDDAVAVEKRPKGYRLYVSIADVSHYVPEGSALDDEAYGRGTSVYFPTMVLPMLPEKLSNDLCSLVPRQDRYAFTAILDFDTRGRPVAARFTRSVINSKYRMTYDLVKEILIDKISGRRAEYADLVPDLERMERLGHLLLDRRMARGSIGFELPEAFVEVGDDGEITNVARRGRHFAHQIIEEFMLAANEAVARALDARPGHRGLFRIHENPDPVKVDEFAKFAATLGLALPKDDQGSPRWFGKVLEAVRGTPLEYIVNNLLLRTMKQARYSADNTGHFGLAADHYTHFTSPIRRYPDLMAHRALAEILTAGGPGARRKKEAGKPAPGRRDPREAGDFLSRRERVAVDAEREMVDRLKVRYMADKIGETFEAVVSGVSPFGLFVELIDSFVSGAVAVTDLTDDYYEVDEKNHRLIGRRTNKILRMGDLVTVRLAGVDTVRRRVNFVPA